MAMPHLVFMIKFKICTCQIRSCPNGRLNFDSARNFLCKKGNSLQYPSNIANLRNRIERASVAKEPIHPSTVRADLQTKWKLESLWWTFQGLRIMPSRSTTVMLWPDLWQGSRILNRKSTAVTSYRTCGRVQVRVDHMNPVQKTHSDNGYHQVPPEPCTLSMVIYAC